MAVDSQREAALQPVAPKRLTGMQQFVLTVSRVWGWVFLFLLIVFFSITGTGFLSLRNSQNILVAIVPVLLLGLGQTFIIIAGGIDLSVNYVMGLASVVMALVIRDLVANGVDETLAILVGMALGIVAALIPGLLNGLIVAKLRVTPFIVTLGMAFVARGVGYLLSDGNVVGGQPPGVRLFGNEALLYYIPGDGGGLYFLQRPEAAGEQLRVLERIFPWPVVVLAIVVGFGIFLLSKTQFGRHTYAIGGNREAASRAGILVDRHTILLFVMSGFTAGLAGVLHTARFNGGSAIAGEAQLMPSIAAVIIGGVSMFGGVGTIWGTIIGALIMAVLQTGLVMLGVESFWQWIVVGIVVIVAVLIDQGRDLIKGRAEAQLSE
ncbi:MAG: ABC transporter permease [Anaerolineae bacterium]|nr:ABC transporter permease [Anaerolineae bacterium]